MSSRPTRSQWRGYAVMCTLLAVALLAVVLWPSGGDKPKPAETSQLQEAIESYSDSIVATTEARRRQRNWQKDTNRRRTHRPYYQQQTEGSTRRQPEQSARRQTEGSTRRDEYYRNLSIELNSADTAGLQSLYGIGPAFAGRIVKYRQRLGGFVRKEQLLEVYGMDSVRYAGITANITIDTSSVAKIDINSASVAELRQHPYLDYYQARAIVDYRNKGFKFGKMSDLLLVGLIDEETVRKLQGYIQFN